MSEEAFRFLLRAYTADNMYSNLNISMASFKFSRATNYFVAVCKSLEKWGPTYKT